MGFALASEFGLKNLKTNLEDKMIHYCTRVTKGEISNVAFPYNEALCFCETYNLSKLQDYIDATLTTTPTYVKEIQNVGGVQGLGGVVGLVIAEKYNLVQLRNRIMKENNKMYSFTQLENVQGFSTLLTDTRWYLAKRVLSYYITPQSIRILDHLHNSRSAVEHEQQTSPATSDSTTGATALPSLTNEVEVLNPFANNTDTDVVVKVEGLKLHLHSAILCHCSPVFKAMLQGNFKEANTKQIELKEKKAQNVIELFQFMEGKELSGKRNLSFIYIDVKLALFSSF